MNPENEKPNSNPDTHGIKRLKLIGVGTAGSLMLHQLNREEYPGAEFAFVNTDNSAPVGPSKQVLLEAKTLRGLGTGGDPDCGRALAEEHFEQMKGLCAGAQMVFLVTGLGGGAGSGITPVLARAAREAGALVMAFVTLPFSCEGNRRQALAREGLEQLKANCDGVICLPNEKAFHLLPANIGFVDAFRATSRLLHDGMRAVWRLVMCRGLVELHFESLRGVLRERHGECAFASFEAAGLERTQKVLDALPTHPLLDGGQALAEAGSVLVSICGGADLSLVEVNQIMAEINSRCPEARVLMGATIEPQFADAIAVTVFATKPLVAEETNAEAREDASPLGELSGELLHPTKTKRPRTRMVPPAPELSQAERDQIIAKQTGKSSRIRKQTGPRMRQTTLPLDIVNKGRFDKSEPTIYKGEDLDLPTYVRRGVALN